MWEHRRCCSTSTEPALCDRRVLVNSFLSCNDAPVVPDSVHVSSSPRLKVSGLRLCRNDKVQSCFYHLSFSPQVQRGAGLFLLLEETPGGCTWQLRSPLCWSPFWYSWISRSPRWSSTGRSTNSRLVQPPQSFIHWKHYWINPATSSPPLKKMADL